MIYINFLSLKLKIIIHLAYKIQNNQPITQLD